MNVIIKKALIKNKPLIKKLMKPYLSELSKFFGGDINDEEYKYLDLYWIEADRIPFLIYMGEQLCGFVLVNKYTKLSENKGAKTIAEFYVTEEFRNQGIGKQSAIYVFNELPGKWEVAVAKENTTAVEFWEKVISNYTKSHFTKVDLDNDSWNGPIYSFKSLAGHL